MKIPNQLTLKCIKISTIQQIVKLTAIKYKQDRGFLNIFLNFKFWSNISNKKHKL